MVNADAAWFRGTVFKRRKYRPERLDKMKWTMAPLTIYLGIKGKLEQLEHHNYYLGNNFDEYAKGIVQLKPQVRLGVYLAYRYYLNLFHKIKYAQPEAILKQRYRVSNPQKGILMFKASLRNAVGLF